MWRNVINRELNEIRQRSDAAPTLCLQFRDVWENKAMADFANGFYEKVIIFMYCVNRPRRLGPFIDLGSSMYRIQGGGDKDLWKCMSCLQPLVRHIISPAQIEWGHGQVAPGIHPALAPELGVQTVCVERCPCHACNRGIARENQCNRGDTTQIIMVVMRRFT